jgi:hypothetical protein
VGLSQYACWLTYDDIRDHAASEREITAASAGLANPDEVMDLDGGTLLAARLGCRTSRPAVPEGTLPEMPKKLTPTSTATDSCA